MDGRRFNKGTKGNKGGRPSKEQEQELIELLGPLEKTALEALKVVLSESRSWAVKLFFQYRYGRPKQIAEVNQFVEQPLYPDVNNFDIKDIYKSPSD